MTTIAQDLRYAVRTFAKAPAFTLVAVVVLALGIGANSAMFTLANAMLFRPLPGRAGDLVGVYSHDRTKPDSYRAFSYPNYADIRARSDVFEGLTAYTFAMVGLPAGDMTRRGFVQLVSSNYFDTLGVRLAAGRAFTIEEERPDRQIPVAIVSYERWQREGLNPSFIGSLVRINATDFTIVGVTPPGFSGTMALVGPEMWLPLGMFDTVVNDVFKKKGTGLADRTNDSLIVAGRFKGGLTAASAQPQLDAVAVSMERDFPDVDKNQVLSTNPLSRMGSSTEPQSDAPSAIGVGLLMALASVVLLIACLNIANMLLARGTARRREIAIRLALGGGRLRIVRQLMTESLLLAVVGAAGGLLLAYGSMQALSASLTRILPLPLQFDARPDLLVLGVTTAIAVLSTIVFGFGPSLRIARADIVSSLKAAGGESRDTAFGRRFGMRNLLVIGQLALAVPLLTTAGLFARGALHAATSDPGFSYDRALLVLVDPSLAGIDERRGRALYAQILDRLRTMPGVEAAAMTSTVPFSDFHEGGLVERVGGGTANDRTQRSATFRIVSSDYFRALGLAPLRGREFTAAEEAGADAPAVAMINEPLARQLFGNADAIGELIQFARRSDSTAPDQHQRPMTVVGVVPGLRDDLFDQAPVPHIYVPTGGSYRASMYAHVRVTQPGSESTVLSAIRRELAAIEPRLPVLELATMRRFHDKGLELWLVRAGGSLFAIFGVLALTLAVVGVYGVKSYVVAQRTREIGIRMALGARSADVRWLVLRDGLWLTAIGLGIGLPIAALVGLLLSKILYHVSPADPVIFVAAPLVLAGAAMLATYAPARRATRIEPLRALRQD
jgi:predicted permease